jgi:hypothetical protein
MTETCRRQSAEGVWRRWGHLKSSETTSAIDSGRVHRVRLADAVYVLHAFQKKSKTRRETLKADIDMIEAGHARGGAYLRRREKINGHAYHVNGGNVFADIGVTNAEEHLVKTQPSTAAARQGLRQSARRKGRGPPRATGVARGPSLIPRAARLRRRARASSIEPNPPSAGGRCSRRF